MRQSLLVGWVAFAYLLLGVSGLHFWLDSGELAAAGYDLGVSHPPGAPGYVLLLRFSTLIGVGSLGFRMAVLSAALGAATVVGVVAILRSRGAGSWVSFGAGAWLLAGLTFVRNTRVVEIYALEGALLVAAVWGFDPDVPEEQRLRRRLVGTVAAVWGAWCFGDLRLALVPAVVVGWVIALRRGRPWARWAPLCVVMTSAVAASLVLAAAREPVANWGDPSTLPRWWSHVTAESIRASFANEILPASAAMWGHNTSRVVRALAEDLGPVGLPMVGVALLSLWFPMREGRRHLAVAALATYLLAVFSVYAIGINPMGVEQRQAATGLVLISVLVVSEAARRWVARLGRAVWAIAPLLFTTLVVPAALESLGDAAATRSTMPHRWTRDALAELPPDALLLTQTDDLAAGVAAAQILEGARPDVAAIPSQHLYKDARPGLAPEHPIAVAYAAAAEAPEDEALRVEAAIAAHAGPVGLELPAAGLLGGVRFWSDRGRLPVRVGKLSEPIVARVPTPLEEVETWMPRAASELDRQRLASALSNDARGLIRAERNLRRGISTLQLVLERVTSRHPSTLVALGALRDRMGDREGAIALTRRALAIEPGRDAALGNLSLYLSRDAATLDEAVEVAERAVALRPWKATGWVRLATARELGGDTEGAAQARAELAKLPNPSL